MSESETEEKSAYESLSPRHRSFVDHFINPQTGNFNRTKAAKLAGYSEKTAHVQGSRMLKNAKISEAVSERLREHSMSADEALSKLTSWGRGSFRPFLEEDFEGNMKLNLTSEKAQANIHLIKKIEQSERILASEGEKLEAKIVKTKIELYDAKDATVQVARIRGQYIDKVEHSGTIDTGVQVIDFTDGDGD